VRLNEECFFSGPRIVVKARVFFFQSLPIDTYLINVLRLKDGRYKRESVIQRSPNIL